MVLITHEQIIIGSKRHLDDFSPEKIINCRQLIAGYVAGPGRKKMHRMIIGFDCLKSRSSVVLRPLCRQDDVVSVA